MTLPASGAITMSQVNVELTKSPTALITLNDTDVRTLAGVLSGFISLANLYGKTFAAPGAGWKISNMGTTGSFAIPAHSSNLARYVTVDSNAVPWYRNDNILTVATPWSSSGQFTAVASPAGPIVFGAGKFVCLQGFQILHYSTDGISWTQGSYTGNFAPFYNIFENNLFVSVGSGGQILTSTDGVTWTGRTSGTSAMLRWVGRLGSHYYACGNSGVILRSTDAITWTSVGPGGSFALSQIGYNPSTGRLIASATSGNYYRSDTGDSGSWTLGNIAAFGTNAISGSTFINNNFLVTGTNGITQSSADGLTWSSVTKGINLAGIFVTINSRVYNTLSASNLLLEVKNSNTFVTAMITLNLGNTNNQDKYSAYGAYSSTLDLYCYVVGQNAMISKDASYWKLIDTGNTSGTPNSVSWINGRFVIAYTQRVVHSTNGINWIVEPIISGASQLNNVAFGNSLYVIVGIGGQIFTSPDLTNWTARTSPTSNDLAYVLWSNSRFVAIGRNGTAIYSTDGTTWSLGSTGTSSDPAGLLWNDSTFITIFGTSSFSSTTGASWTNNGVVTGSINPMVGLTYDGSKYYVADTLMGNGVFESVNGINSWSKVYTPFIVGNPYFDITGYTLGAVGGADRTAFFAYGGGIFTNSTSTYRSYIGVAPPTLGNNSVATWPPSGYTSLQNSSLDDGFTTVPIPFTFRILNQSYTSAFVGCNTYVTFGSGSNLYSGLGASVPALPKIMLGAADNSYQRVGYFTSGTDFVRIRYEGTAATSGTLGNSNIIYELTFYNPSKTSSKQVVELRIGLHNRLTGEFGIASASSYLKNQTLMPLMSYVFTSDFNGTTWEIFPGAYVST